MTTCHGLGGTGTQYSYAQLEGLWIKAGGSKAMAALMAAIADAESRGCSTALNPTDNGGSQSSYGLWQLSNGTHSPPIADPYDGLANAKGAVAKFKGQGLGAWGTYGSGAYKQFLQGAVPPDLSVKGGGGGGTSTATLTAASSADCLFTLPSASVKTLFGVGPSVGVGGECLVSKSEGRAVAGSLVLAGGGVILALGVVVLVAFGLRGTKAGKQAQQVVSVVPGLPSGGKAAAAAEAVPVAAVA